MSIVTDAQDALRPWVTSPWARLKFEARCLRRAVLIHEGNNNARKGVLMVLLGVWAALTLGVSTGPDVPGWVYTSLTAFVFLLAGRMWGIEVRNLGLPFEVQIDGKQDGDGDQQDDNSK
jgi:hypothetical protein